MAKLNDVYPVNQTWDQLINLAIEQEANLDRDSINSPSGFCTSSRRSRSSIQQRTNDRDHKSDQILLHPW